MFEREVPRKLHYIKRIIHELSPPGEWRRISTNYNRYQKENDRACLSNASSTFRHSLTARARSIWTERRSVVERRKIAMDAGQLVLFPPVLTLSVTITKLIKVRTFATRFSKHLMYLKLKTSYRVHTFPRNSTFLSRSRATLFKKSNLVASSKARRNQSKLEVEHRS